MDSFDKVVISMLYSDEGIFYLSILQQCKRVETKDIPTAGVGYRNGKIYLYVNKEWFDKLPLDQQVAILQHEMRHLVFLHPSRCGSRNPVKFNVAADIAINQDIPNLPNGSLLPKMFKLPPKLSAEEYYDLLPKNEGSGGKGTCKGDCKNCKESPQASQDSKGITCPRGDHGKWKEFEDGSTLAKETVKEVLREAVERTQKARGVIPGDLEDFLKDMLTPAEVPWWETVKRTLKNKIRSELSKYTWKRENRRGGITQGKIYRRKAPFLMVVDTSGSMSDKDITTCAEQLLGICKKFRAPLPIILHDAEVYFVGTIKKLSDMGKVLSKASRGGTDFQVVIDKVIELKLPIETIVWCTDLECPFPDEPKYNIIWVVPESSKENTAPYGQVVYINNSKIKKED